MRATASSPALLALASACLAVAASAQSSQCILPEAVYHGPAGKSSYGRSVSASGDRFALGAPSNGSPFPDGEVEIYVDVGGTWVLEQVLEPLTLGLTSLNFGAEIDLDGDQLAVTDNGWTMARVDVFTRGPSGWVLEQEVACPDGLNNPVGGLREFGCAVAIDGDRLLVGARKDGDAAGSAGAVYHFRRVAGQWVFVEKLFSPVPQVSVHFGDSVALEGARAIVGTPQQTSNVAGNVTGAAFAFDLVGGVWSFTQRLDPPADAESFTKGFGTSVDLLGDRLAVGYYDPIGPNTRAVAVYGRVGGVWDDVASAQTTDPGSSAFGATLALATEDRLIVGDQQADAAETFAGAAYVFEREGAAWPELTKLFDPLGHSTDLYGYDVTGDGQRLVVGADRTLWNGSASGSAHVYRALPEPQVYCTAKVNSAGCTPKIGWTGTPSFFQSTLRVEADDVLANQVGLLLWSLSSGTLPFGGGTLCLGSPLTRTQGQFSGGGADPCSGSYSYQFTTVELILEGMVPGTTVYTQYWSRDTGFAPPNAVGLTDALAFTVCP